MAPRYGDCVNFMVSAIRLADAAALEVVAVTLPPWPGEEEAIVVAGRWVPNAEAPAEPASGP